VILRPHYSVRSAGAAVSERAIDRWLVLPRRFPLF
jgi:hypothetical protein